MRLSRIDTPSVYNNNVLPAEFTLNLTGELISDVTSGSAKVTAGLDQPPPPLPAEADCRPGPGPA